RASAIEGPFAKTPEIRCGASPCASPPHIACSPAWRHTAATARRIWLVSLRHRILTMLRLLLAALAILVAWTTLDLLLHRLFLAPIYEANPNLWRPFDQMNVALIYAVTFILIGVFVGACKLLVRPKSLRAGLSLGAFIGLALGVSAGFGTYIH